MHGSLSTLFLCGLIGLSLAIAQTSPAEHNDLGISRFQLGDIPGALEEFRIAAKLAPSDANVHFNLGEALARMGDSAAAIAELKEAAVLSPSDASLTRLLHGVENPDAIKVDVTRILVPVTVADRAGHNITGLTQSDFKIFEDGVEQKITAFSSESFGGSLTTLPSDVAARSPSQTTPAKPAIRRTYLVCIDTLHTSFAQFGAVRDALIALFKQEHSTDSQCVVIALGASPEMVVNMTTDPAVAIAAFQNKKFQKIFLDGQVGGLGAEIDRFRRDLNETREACNHASDYLLKAKCSAGLDRAHQRARQIAELDRVVTTGFLRQFRSLVGQLARGRERRTVVLISPGFQVDPGREANSLVDAFFPPASHCLIPIDLYCPPSEATSTSRLSQEFEPILKQAAATNITVHTIDSRGLYIQKSFDASSNGAIGTVGGAVDSTDRANASAEGGTLGEIAGATGGLYLHNSNDLAGSLQRTFADGREYYMLSYVSTNPAADGTFRAISIQVRDPKAVVNAKRGYWAQ